MEFVHRPSVRAAENLGIRFVQCRLEPSTRPERPETVVSVLAYPHTRQADPTTRNPEPRI
jgi:hypothetical protein